MNQLRDSTQSSMIFNLWVDIARSTQPLTTERLPIRRAQEMFDDLYDAFFERETSVRMEYPLRHR